MPTGRAFLMSRARRSLVEALVRRVYETHCRWDVSILTGAQLS
jgi:hypothetical protein